jgi:hypothetical protein
MSALLVAMGAALLWPAVRGHGRGIAIATMIALLGATPAYGIATAAGTPGAALAAAAFAAGCALARTAASARDAAARARLRRLWRGGAAAAAAGGALLLSRGGLEPGRAVDGLFGSADGVLFWTPVLWLGLAGIAARGVLPSRALAVALLLATAVGLDPLPVRGARAAAVLPLLAVGLARAFGALRDAAARRPLAPVAAMVAVLAGWNGLLMAQYGDGRIPRDDTVEFPRVVRAAFSDVASAAGSPPAWPANWIFAARHGVTPARYDRLAGLDAFDGRHSLGGVIDVGDPDRDAALLGEGWSVRHPCGAEVCRAVESAASLRLPLARARDVELAVVAAGAGTLTVSVNGVAVMRTALDGGLVPRRAHVPRARFQGGLDTVTLSVDPGGRALVDRVVLRRREGDA